MATRSLVMACLLSNMQVGLKHLTLLSGKNTFRNIWQDMTASRPSRFHAKASCIFVKFVVLIIMNKDHYFLV